MARASSGGEIASFSPTMTVAGIFKLARRAVESERSRIAPRAAAIPGAFCELPRLRARVITSAPRSR